MTRVFVTRRWPVDPGPILGSFAHVDVFAPDRAPTRDELIDRARSCAAIVTSVADRIDRDVLDELRAVKVIAQAAVGYDNVDVATCRARGILVTHTPDVLTDSTADLAIALLLGVARRVREGEEMVRAGQFGGWSPTMLLGIELRDKTLGVLGYGRIGRAVAQRARAFGMRVIASRRDDQRFVDPMPHGGSIEGVSREDLIARSDVISVHVPGTRATRHLLGEREFARMKRGVIVLNTARGTVIDEGALVRALESGHVGGAGLDVYEEEPRVHPGLIARDDVVLLPHLGSATREARARMASTALADAARVIRGLPPLHLVPELRA